MYGIVNKAIEELVTENFGETTWKEVKAKSGIEIDYFLSTEPYDDSITYKLAMAASEVTGLSLQQVLFSFGEWWVLRTSKEKYGALMQSGGTNLKEFLFNLPNFHNRILLMYPKLQPPEFEVKEIDDHSIHLTYISKREGLQDFVDGLLHGLGKMYETPVEVELIQARNQNHTDIFKVSW